MPLTLLPAEHRALHETLEAPGPMLDLLGGAALRVAGAASKLGVFEALAGGPRTTAEVARAAATDPRGTTLLLQALRAYGYVAAHDASDASDGGGGRWALTPLAEKWMLRGRPGSFADTLEFWDSLLFGLWGELETSLATGVPPVDWYRWLEAQPRTLRTFQGMLAGIARRSAPGVVDAVALPAGAERLVDVGGSHAVFSLAFLRAHPGLAATVLDFPGALEVGRENARAEGLQERVELVPGDFLSPGPLGSGAYDVALLCSIVHGLSPEANTGLLRRVRDALKPGGRVVIVEQTEGGAEPRGPVDDAFMRTFSLNLFHLLGAQTWSFAEIAGWLEAAGFRDPAETAVRGSLDRVVQAVRA
ncbi:MAG TPA: methyltransferase [Longimicrobium sp.]|nr:methyltransferase [Longimicrobium sp.]